MATIISQLPSTQTAVIAGPDREFLVTHSHPVYNDIEPDVIIIKTHAVALNPVDTKLSGPFVTPGVTFGFDVAGVVVAIGSGTTKENIQIGDRVCGIASGIDKKHPTEGAFAEYTTLVNNMSIRIPDHMSFEEAASIPLALNSAAMALFWSLGIDWRLLEKPSEKPFPVLVYGGSTSVGTMAIQLVKLCGLKPITTCSPKNYPLVQSHGAEAVFDYHSPTCGADIRAYTKNALCHRSCGGRYTGLDPLQPHIVNTRKAIKPDWVVAHSITGRPCNWPAPFEREGNPEMLKWAVPLYGFMERLLAEGKIRVHPIKVSRGFDAIIEGVEVLRRKEISAQKLVFTVA